MIFYRTLFMVHPIHFCDQGKDKERNKNRYFYHTHWRLNAGQKDVMWFSHGIISQKKAELSVLPQIIYIFSTKEKIKILTP